MTDILYVAIGLVLLVLAGDALVRGAVNMSLRLGIPPLVVGLTVVAFGTSAPELLVSVKAILEGVSGMAMGNVVGSNIANVLLVLGVPAIITTIHSSDLGLSRSYFTMLAATALFIVVAFMGPIVWWHGIILLIGLAMMLFDNYCTARSHRRAAGAALAASDDDDAAALEGADPSMPWWKIAAFLLAGIIGVASMVGNIDVAPSMLYSGLWVMLAASLILIPFILMRYNITRTVGIGFVTIYVAYTASLVL
jgi:cation:H+ antiporter